MAAKGYCTKADVAAYLGITLTAGQQTQCDDLILKAEARVDQMTRRAWLTGPQTDEIGLVRCDIERALGYIYTKYYPIASVASVKVRSTAFDATDTTLTANASSEGYQLYDLSSGLIYVPRSYVGYISRVSYTPVATMPQDLELAVIQLVAHWLQAALQPETAGIESYSIGQDLTVKYRSSAGYSIPSDVERVILSYRDRRI